MDLRGETDQTERLDVEIDQRRALRRNRLAASMLLLGAIAIFGVSTVLRNGGFWMALLRAGAEAGVVGALADWFAVTAVFRRPLGLPIPHTAIVPRNKDRIGDGLGAFVAGNFLTAPLLSARLRSIDPASHLASWLSEPPNAAAAAEKIMQLLPYLVRTLEDREIRDFAVRALGEELRAADLSAGLGRALALLTTGVPFEALFDQMLDGITGLLTENEMAICEIVEERTAWWLPRALDRRIAAAIIAALTQFTAELREPGNPRRIAFRSKLEVFAHDLVQSPAHREKVHHLKSQLLEQPAFAAWLAGLWDSLRGVILADLEAPQSRTREALRNGLLSLGRTLQSDVTIRTRLNAGLEEALLAAVVPWRHAIGRFIADVVRGWETQTVVDRLELALGGDLQYIRITGTLVGACVGCLLFLISRLLTVGDQPFLM